MQDKIKRVDDFELLREVVKNQGELKIGQALLVGKVDLLHRTINVDNGQPCIVSRLRCNESDIKDIATELTVVKALKAGNKSLSKTIMDLAVTLATIFLALKGIGIIK